MNEDNKVEEPVIPTEPQVDPNERVRELEEQLAKEQEEKENYKQGMLKYKEQAKEEPETEWNDDTKKFQKETLTKAEKLAEDKALKTVETFNEKAGIAKFQEAHPDVDMKEVLANYNPKNGKFSAESVARDLERAFVLYQHDTGQLSTESVKAEEKGRKKGIAEAKVADLNTVSTTSQKTVPQGSSLTDSELEMAKRMKVDPEELAAENMDEPAVIEIN